jgi:hypothetical protein
MVKRKASVVSRASNLPKAKKQKVNLLEFGPELPSTAASKKGIGVKEKSKEAPFEGFRLINVDCLQSGIQAACSCSCGKKGTLTLSERGRCGLASVLVLCCSSCKKKTDIPTSPTVETGKVGRKPYEVNLRYVYGLRSVGIGRAGGAGLCGALNVPPPPLKFANYSKTFLKAITGAAEGSMNRAATEALAAERVVRQELVELAIDKARNLAEEAAEKRSEANAAASSKQRSSAQLERQARTLEVEAQDSKKAAREAEQVVNNPNNEVPASFDGSFHTRGFSSMHGFATAISVETGKVLDVQCQSKFCHGCVQLKAKADTPEFDEFARAHKDHCSVTHTESSGAMEVTSVLQMFERSEKERGLTYSHYLGDGDSKGHLAVKKADPYKGRVEVKKLECINHVAKRMGTRLRNLVSRFRVQKCKDGKPLGGKGRMTDKLINKLQGYYGQAFREAVAFKGTQEQKYQHLHKTIWRAYYHHCSTDQNPHHTFCPEGSLENPSWCKFNQAKVTGEKYTHKETLPPAVTSEMQKVYRDLTNRDLLTRSLHGKTQNVNESVNQLPWKKARKTEWCGYRTIQLVVLQSVLEFNDGAVSQGAVFEALGFSEGFYSRQSALERDRLRAIRSERKALHLNPGKQCRKSCIILF